LNCGASDKYKHNQK